MIPNIGELADKLKGLKLGDEDFTPENLQKAIESEDEIELVMPDVLIYTQEEADELKANVAREAAKNSASSILEQEVKRIRNEKELNFTGKTLPNLINAIEEKVRSEYTGDVDSKIKEKDSMIEQLQSNMEALENEYTTKLTEKENKIKNIDINYKLNGLVPKELPKGLDAEDVITIFRTKHQIEFEDGLPIVKREGNVMRDEKTQKNKSIDEVFLSFLDEKNIKSNTNGRGEGDQGGKTSSFSAADVKTNEDFERYMKANDFKEGQEAEALTEVRKENKQFLLR